MGLQLAATRGNWFLIYQILYEMAPIVKRLLTWVGMGKASWNPRCLSLQEWTIEPNKFPFNKNLRKSQRKLSLFLLKGRLVSTSYNKTMAGFWLCFETFAMLKSKDFHAYVLFKIKIKLWKRLQLYFWTPDLLDSHILQIQRSDSRKQLKRKNFSA
jgi:hypothetical protein